MARSKLSKPKKYVLRRRVITDVYRYTGFSILNASFRCLCKEMIAFRWNGKYRFAKKALEYLQEDMEAYLVSVFADAEKLAHHAGRTTVTREDVAVTLELRGEQRLADIMRTGTYEIPFVSPDFQVVRMSVSY